MKNETELKGIRGWLVISILGLFLTIGLQLLYLVNLYRYYDLLGYPLLVFIRILIIILSGVTLFCIFNKLKVGRTIGIITYSIFAAISLISINLIGVISGIIWALYFLNSKRVKNTLIN